MMTRLCGLLMLVVGVLISQTALAAFTSVPGIVKTTEGSNATMAWVYNCSWKYVDVIIQYNTTTYNSILIVRKRAFENAVIKAASYKTRATAVFTDTTIGFNLAGVTQSDAGYYTCHVTRGRVIDTNVSIIFVYGKPVITSVQASPDHIIAGDTVNLSCNAATTSRPSRYARLVYSWWKGAEQIVNSSTYVFSANKEDNKAQYKCRVEEIGSSLVWKNVTLSIKYAPYKAKLNTSLNLTKNEGDSLSSTCSADCNPPCQYRWCNISLGGSPASLGDITTVGVCSGGSSMCVSGSTLMTNTLSRFDQGSYTCEASNNISLSRSARLQLTVNYPASVMSITSDPFPIHSNHGASIVCMVDSQPSSNISLTQPNNKLMKTVQTSHSLNVTIESPTCWDAGTYTCTAGNGVGQTPSVQQAINVLCPPSFYNIEPASRVVFTPYGASEATSTFHIISSPDISDGVTFRFYNSTGEIQPQPYNTWVNMTSYRPHDSSVHTTNVTFTITNVTGNNFGTYVFVTKNREGRMKPLSITVIEDGPPQSITNLRRMEATEDSLEVAWTSGLDGGHQQKFIVEYWNSSNTWKSPELNESTTHWVATGLHPECEYTFRVLSRNMQGTTESQHNATYTTTKRRDSPFPIWLIATTLVPAVAVIVIIMTVVLIKKRRLPHKKNGEEQSQQHSQQVSPQVHGNKLVRATVEYEEIQDLGTTEGAIPIAKEHKRKSEEQSKQRTNQVLSQVYENELFSATVEYEEIPDLETVECAVPITKEYKPLNKSPQISLPPTLVYESLGPGLSADDVTVNRKLYTGAHFTVCLGRLANSRHTNQTVIIKRTRVAAENHRIQSEIEACKLIGVHSNVILFISNYTSKGVGHMVMEYASEDKLSKYLKHQETSLDKHVEGPLLHILSGLCLDSTRGLLAIHHTNDRVVMPCLSGDTVLVTSEGVCKLTGMLTKAEYLQHWGSQEALKVARWVAPEVMEDVRNHDMRSDVWSLAVLIWHIFSTGTNPFDGVDDSQIHDHIADGNRLLKPPQVNKALYTQLSRCWSEVAWSRPRVVEISRLLQQLTREQQANNDAIQSDYLTVLP